MLQRKLVLLPSRGALVGQNCQCLLSQNFSRESQRGKSKWESFNAVVALRDTTLGKATNTKKKKIQEGTTLNRDKKRGRKITQ